MNSIIHNTERDGAGSASQTITHPRKLLTLAVFGILFASLCLMMCSCTVKQSKSSNADTSSSSVYSFPDAGFETEFPDEPEKAEETGVYQERETTYTAFQNNTMTFVSIAIAPDGFAANAISNPEDEQAQEVLKLNLKMLAGYEFVPRLNVQDVDVDTDLEYFDFNRTSPFSGWAYFDGYLNLSKYGGPSHEQKHFCCGFIYNSGQIYSVFSMRDTEAAAKAAARSFKLTGVTPISNNDVTAAQTGEIPQGAIPWQEAQNHIGETATVYGAVIETEYASESNNQPTFIDIGASYPDETRVTMVVWGEDRHAFSQAPEEMYKGKTVCVTGEIYLYNGVCNIKVTSPSQVQVL